MNRNKHIGSSFDDFLESEGLLEESASVAVKRVIAWQVAEAMKAARHVREIADSRSMPAREAAAVRRNPERA